MRAGHLRTRLSILDAGGEVGKLWADVRPPTESGESKGLREAAQTKVIIRPRPGIRPGMILAGREYVLVVEAGGEHLARGRDLHLSCTRLIGATATYRRTNGDETPVLASIKTNTPYIGLQGQMMDFRYRIELPNFQCPGAWQVGDAVILNGAEYVLLGPIEDGDDGTVTAFSA